MQPVWQSETFDSYIINVEDFSFMQSFTYFQTHYEQYYQDDSPFLYTLQSEMQSSLKRIIKAFIGGPSWRYYYASLSIDAIDRGVLFELIIIINCFGY